MRTLKFKLLLPFLLLSTLGLIAQNKEISKDFSGVKEVDMTGKYGPIKVSKSSDNQVYVLIKITIEGKNAAETQKVLDRFKLDISQSGPLLTVQPDFGVKNWQKRNGITSLTFKDGTQVNNITKLEIEFLLSIPDLERLSLTNKYNNIDIDHNLSGNLEVNLYDGKLTAQNVEGYFNMENKYGEASLKKTGATKLDLYDAEVEKGDCGVVSVTSKYSELEIGNCSSLELNAYDDKIIVGNIAGALVVEDKYSDFVFGDFTNAKLNLYDADMRIGSGKMVEINSKYSDLRFSILENLVFDASYDDEIKITELESLTIESKYSNLDVGRISKKLDLVSYDDNVDIDRFEGSVELVRFDGKYTDLNLNLVDDLEYRLSVNTTYGKFKYTESRYDVSFYKEKNSKLEMKAQTKGASAQSPMIELSAYSCNIRL